MVDVRTNLLKNRHTLSEKDYQHERNLLRQSIIGFIVVIVVLVGLSVWNFVLSNKLTNVEKAITNSSKDMQGLIQASAKQVYLKSRLQLVTGFLADRSLVRESLQKIFSVNITGTHVAGLSFENDTTLAVSYEADSASTLNDLIKYYESDTGYFVQAVSRGISRSKEGKYQLALALTLPKAGK